MKQNKSFFTLKGVVNTGNKQERILNTLQPLYKNGMIIHNEDLKRDELESQLLFFTKAKHDDCPDSLEIAIKNMKKISKDSSVSRVAVARRRAQLRNQGVRGV